jgi:hypothetical protein
VPVPYVRHIIICGVPISVVAEKPTRIGRAAIPGISGTVRTMSGSGETLDLRLIGFHPYVMSSSPPSPRPQLPLWNLLLNGSVVAKSRENTLEILHPHRRSWSYASLIDSMPWTRYPLLYWSTGRAKEIIERERGDPAISGSIVDSFDAQPTWVACDRHGI